MHSGIGDMRQSKIRYVIVLFGLVLIFGGYLRIKSLSGTRVSHPLRADAGQYFRYAYNMRFHHVYSKQFGGESKEHVNPVPDAVRTPGYPLVLSFFMDARPSGRTLYKILIFQLIISVLTLYLAFELFRKFLPAGMALAASFLTALSPHLIVANSYILTETLFCFILVLAAFQVGFLTVRPAGWLAGVTGAIIGFAALVKPSLQYFPVVMAMWLFIHYGPKKGLRLFLALLAGFMLVFSPWIIRNIVTLKASSDNRLKINFLHHGMYPDFTYDGDEKSYGFPYRFDPRSEEIQKSVSSVLTEIRRRFQTEPWQHLKWYLLKKPAAFWGWNIVQGQGDAFVYPVVSTPYASNGIFRGTHQFMYYLHWPLVLLGLCGCLIAWRPVTQAWEATELSIPMARFISLLLGYFIFIHIIGTPFPRYSVPLRPFLYGMALYALHVIITINKNNAVSSKPGES
jgi:4-amino-4-deoxy-L-arabinose transferase-like glycosyltransferase